MAQAKVLIMGATFKENVSDIRNSKVAEMVLALQDFSIQVDIDDPHADSQALQSEYGIELSRNLASDYDAVIIAVAHSNYLLLDDPYFCSITKPTALVADLKGMYRNKIINRPYYSL